MKKKTAAVVGIAALAVLLTAAGIFAWRTLVLKTGKPDQETVLVQGEPIEEKTEESTQEETRTGDVDNHNENTGDNKKQKPGKLADILEHGGILDFFLDGAPITPEEARKMMDSGEFSGRKKPEHLLKILGQKELPAQDRTSFVQITSCKIGADAGNVKLEYAMEHVPVSDDEYFYLFELAAFETEHDEEYLTRTSKWGEDEFSFKLKHNTSASRLYSKFVIAVKLDGEFVDISRGHYITNPEAVAKYTYSHPKTSSIKGLIVDPNKLAGSELEDLGVKHAVYNIPIGYILGETSNGAYPTVYYTYNDRKYAFNGLRIAEFDNIFKTLSSKGMVVTAVLLNNKNNSYPQLIHPNSGGGSAPYYMFNAANEEGVEYLEAVATFLAKRYSGGEHGKVVNWVVGNEINARKAWNYMDYTSVEEYAEEYARAFRIFYNGIKSVSANANVYISLDQMWDRNLSAKDSYDAKDVLDAFNRSITLRGNIDWGLAHHPYPVPLTWPKFWSMPSNYKSMNLVRNSVDTPYITVGNIHVLTDYMQKEEFLSPGGKVRSIILSEVGFTSDHGEELQAAAFAYAYYIASNNQHIDSFVLNKQADMSEEIAQGLSLGLNRMDGSHKYIYNVYKHIDTDTGYDYTEFAKAIIGIADWSQVIIKK